jgi:hypothetical protein
VRSFLLPLIISGFIVGNPAWAKGGPLHLFSSQLSRVSRAGPPLPSLGAPSDFLSGCGRGRYRDAATRRCRGPADVDR